MPAQILLLQPPADGANQSIAVQRYADELPVDAIFELSVTSTLNPPTGALLLFLFDKNDAIHSVSIVAQ